MTTRTDAVRPWSPGAAVSSLGHPVTPTPPVAPERDDVVLPATRALSAFIVPFLIVAFVVLYGYPRETGRLFAWNIKPPMTPMTLGAVYIGGAYFFVQAFRAKQWHTVKAGFVAVGTFATLLGVATIIHWDRFNHDHVSFWAWLLLYASTPVLLPILWVKNQRTDPKVAEEGDVKLPQAVRVAVGVGGALQLAFALFMFFWPTTAARAWPWPLDAATARSLSAFVAFPAVTWVWFLFEDRWSSFRITQQTATLGMVLLGIAAVRAHGDFRTGGWFVAYLAALVVAITLSVVLYVAMERKTA